MYNRYWYYAHPLRYKMKSENKYVDIDSGA